MNNKPRNPSAFPQSKTAGSVSVSNGGMTLRDYFAAKFMQAFISGAMADGTSWDAAKDEARTALLSYSMADAMLAERERER